MELRELFIGTVLLGSLIAVDAESVAPSPSQGPTETNVQTFVVKGVVKELKADGNTIVISHEAISNYMDAMTMPFRAQAPAELKGLRTGDEISFNLRVTETRSWVDHIVRIGATRMKGDKPAANPTVAGPPGARSRHPLLDFKFTNELGQAVSLSDFRGQALAITFFFSRCPIPDFCPRLSQNFQEASQKLGSLPGAPTNWHFLSVSFDPAFDTPPVLKAYGERYHYDPTRWSFLCGPKEEISELARQSGVEVESDGALFNHNFRTLIIDAAGHLQMSFPMGGDLSEMIVGEMLKAATNRTVAGAPSAAPSPSTSWTAPGAASKTDIH
jgi:protein SCO1